MRGCWREVDDGDAVRKHARRRAADAGFGAALLQGLAPDGGLYVPQRWPALMPQDFAGS